MIPTLYSWILFAGIFAAETALIVVLTTAACHCLRSAKRQRVCWQAALIAMTLISINELTGLRAHIPAWRPTQIAQGRLVVRLSDPLNKRDAQNSSRPTVMTNDPNAETRHPVTWPGWLWISGTVTLLLLTGTTRAWLLAERRKMQPASPEVWSMAKPLFKPLRLPYANIHLWRRVRGPVAFGFWRPTVALPLDFAERFTARQRQVMLAHELAHLAAHDPFWFALTDFFCAVAWWHPLAWWMRHEFRRTCEGSADEASALIPEGPATLAESLVAFGRELSLSRPTGGLGVAGSGFRSDLALRVKALLEKSTGWQELSLSWRCVPAVFGIICAAMTMALPIRAANPAWLLAAASDHLKVKPDTTRPLISDAKNVSSTRTANDVTSGGNGPESNSVAFVVKFFSVPENNNPGRRELDSLFGPHPEEPQKEGRLPNVFRTTNFPSLRNVTADCLKTEGQVVVLDDLKFTKVRERLLAQGLTCLAAPRVQTQTGRLAQISTMDATEIVFDVETTDATPTKQA